MALVERVAAPDDLVVARIESAPFAENTYVVHRAGIRECLVVDPGFEPDAVVDWIEERGLAPVYYGGPVQTDRVSLADLTLPVTTIPGHSRGHVVFRVEDCAPPVVFGGDVLFRGSIGRTDFPDGDFAALVAGIRRGLYTLPDETIVFPGHGDSTTVGHERRHNPFVSAQESASWRPGAD